MNVPLTKNKSNSLGTVNVPEGGTHEMAVNLVAVVNQLLNSAGCNGHFELDLYKQDGVDVTLWKDNE